MIWSSTFITCDECGKRVFIGDDCFEYMNQYLCETCYDEKLEQQKEDARIEVNDSNFDLEKED